MPIAEIKLGYRILYLPIEIRARELLGKVWLASRAVDRGWAVVMGDHKEVRPYAERHAPGVYVEISIPERKAALQESLSKAGQRLVNLCEESIIYAHGDDYCLRKVGATALKWTDRLFSPGNVNAGHVEQCFPEFQSKIAVTGNPRFDVLRPELRDVYANDVRAIRAQYGSFLLVNTNFGRANPAKKREIDYVDYLVGKRIVQPGAHADFHRHFTAFKKRQILAFRELLAEIARSGRVSKILVRPHPSENHDAWRQWCKPLGIEVRYEGNANTWALAADAVLHPGCTTGIEALLLDRPTISHVAEPGSEFVNLADLISEQVQSAEEVYQCLDRALEESDSERRSRYENGRTRLAVYIANVEPPYAADRILDELDRLEVPLVSAAEAGLNGEVRAETLGLGNASSADAGEAHIRLKMQKNPGLTVKDIAEPASCWMRLGLLKRMPEIRPLARGLFVLS